MTGGSERGAGDKDGVPTLTGQVPVGWQRTVEDGAVAYISPSGTALSSAEEVREYLLTDSTCKCGLECPLVIHKVFNFDPVAVVRPQSQLPGKAEEDMTKLCNHRRKVVAMAALCRSMQLPLRAHGAGSSFCSMEGRDPRVIREDGGHCTYSAQPRPNSSFPLTPMSLTLLQNGSIGHSNALLSPDPALLAKKLPLPPPSCNMIGCGKPQWCPRPSVPQTIIQRLPHAPGSPSASKPGPHMQVYSLDLSSSSSSSSSSSPSLVMVGRPGPNHQQGSGVKSPSPLSLCPSPLSLCPSPLSLCPSPSRTLDSTSPRARSRHSSSTSSTSSTQGSGLSAAGYPQGGKPCPSRSPLPSSAGVCVSPKAPRPPASPRSRLEGMLQHYKDCSTGAGHPAQYHLAQSNQSNFQVPQNLSPFASDRKNGPAAATAPAGALNSAGAGALLGLPLGQLLNQQKSQQHVASFPASSLLSAAAKAQLASQRSQGGSPADAGAAHSPAGIDKEPQQQSKVSISTLNSSIHPSSASRPPSVTAFLLPHSPSPAPAPAPPLPPLAEKASRRKRQRRSPTVLSMLKESQLHHVAPASISPSPPAANSPLLPAHLENHPRGPEDARRLGAPPPPQPLSALLQLLSMQNAQAAAHSGPSPASAPAQSLRQVYAQPPSPGLCLSQPAPYGGLPVGQSLALEGTPPLPPTSNSSSQAFPLLDAAGEEMDAANAAGLKPGHHAALLNFSQPHAGSSAGPQPDIGSQILSLLGQLSSLPPVGLGEKGCGVLRVDGGHDETSYSSNHSQDLDTEGTLVAEDPQVSAESRLLGGLALPPSDSSNPLQLAESFPFMNQDQLLQLLSANSGLPSLLPPFLGSLPMGLAPPQPGLLSQASPLALLPSMLGAQGDFPLNLIGLLNPPPPPASAPNQAAGGGEAGEKPPGLQALLMASLLPMAGLGHINLELPALGQQFPTLPPDGLSLDKAPPPGLLDSLLTGTGLLEALQGLSGLATPGDGSLQATQSLLLSAHLPPPAFLSLNPALLAAALGPADPLTTPQHPPTTHSQGTLASTSLGSTSVSCASLMPSSVPDGVHALAPMTDQDKNNTQTAQLLPPLLPPGMLGDLAALGNINSLHSLLGAGPLLLPQMQAPPLGMPLSQGQGALNPLACLLSSLQLNMGPPLVLGEKPLGLHDAPSPAPQEQLPVSQLAQEAAPNPGHAPAPQASQREGALFDPYSSFMDTIYTSFLQVSGKGSEGPAGGGGGGGTPLSYPGGEELPGLAPPSLSPRRACSVHNPNLSRLSMETAQSPARGTPKLSEDASATPPPQQTPPAAPAFMEEAKTDGSSSALCLYSNGVASGAAAQGEEEEEEEEGGGGRRAPPQAYLSPRERASEPAQGDMGEDTDPGRTPAVRTGARRGRKRKQTLQRVPEVPGDIDAIIEEPIATTALPKPVRSTRGKRRRVVR